MEEEAAWLASALSAQDTDFTVVVSAVVALALLALCCVCAAIAWREHCSYRVGQHRAARRRRARVPACPPGAGLIAGRDMKCASHREAALLAAGGGGGSGGGSAKLQREATTVTLAERVETLRMTQQLSLIHI